MENQCYVVVYSGYKNKKNLYSHKDLNIILELLTQFKVASKINLFLLLSNFISANV